MSPCKDCKDRTIPKYCERTCDKWIKYKSKHTKTKEAIRQERKIKDMLWKHYWGGNMTKEELANELISIRHKMQKSELFTLRENDIMAEVVNLLVEEFICK